MWGKATIYNIHYGLVHYGPGRSFAVMANYSLMKCAQCTIMTHQHVGRHQKGSSNEIKNSNLSLIYNHWSSDTWSMILGGNLKERRNEVGDGSKAIEMI